MIRCALTIKAQECPDANALIWGGGRTISWGLLNTHVHSTARYLKEVGLKAGSRAAILSANSVEYIIVLLAMLRVGVQALPLPLQWPGDLYLNVLKPFAPDLIFVDGPVPEEITEFRSLSLKTAVSFEHADGFWGSGRQLGQEVDPSQPAVVVLTSGSSGRRKGVVLSYGALLENASSARAIIPFGPGDRWGLSLPLWHVSGLSLIFRALAGGGAIVIPSQKEISDIVLTQAITHISMVPTQLKRVLADEECLNALKKFKAILLGGAPLPEDLLLKAKTAGLPVFATYGMTETCSQIATGAIGPDGKPHVRVLCAHELKLSEEGEVLVRGRAMFSGYLFGAEMNARDPEGWFATGDLGFLRAGELTILGRKDNMFISGGENIHPEDIETQALAHPAVQRALVVPIPDEAFGMIPVIFIDQLGDVPVTNEEMMAFLVQGLPRYAVPKIILPWPSGQTGMKPDRQVFQELAKPT